MHIISHDVSDYYCFWRVLSAIITRDELIASPSDLSTFPQRAELGSFNRLTHDARPKRRQVRAGRRGKRKFILEPSQEIDGG
jgi:hypothetical protein